MAVPGRTLIDNLAIRMAGTPGTWAAVATVYGNWILMKGVARRALFVAMNGELDADLKVEVWEATDASGTSAQELTGITTGKTFTNGTDEGRVGLIEVTDDDLSTGFSYVALLPTPGATDSFAALAILSDLYEYPASNATTDGVAWVDGGGY